MCFGGKKGNLIATVSKWCRWVISLGSGSLEASMCLHLGPAAGGSCGGTRLPQRCHRVVVVRHSRAINGKCFRSSLLGDRQCFCSAHSRLLPLLPGERSTAQWERCSYNSPHGPKSEERAICSEQLKDSSWVLPFAEQHTALVVFTCSQHQRTSEKPEERQKYPLLFTARFTRAEAGLRGCMTNC